MTVMIMTRVPVEPDSIEELAALFAATYRDVVAGHADWHGAWFTADRVTSTITVVARWADPASYQQLRISPEFAEAMQRFAHRFTGPPEISINELLVEM